MENETLLKKVRDSKVHGPFRIDSKQSGFGHSSPLFLKRWRQDTSLSDESFLQSPKDVANYLEQYYLGKTEYGYAWEFVGERKRLRDEKVLKIQSIPHPASTAARRNLPDSYTWLRVRPSF